MSVWRCSEHDDRLIEVQHPAQDESREESRGLQLAIQHESAFFFFLSVSTPGLSHLRERENICQIWLKKKDLRASIWIRSCPEVLKLVSPELQGQVIFATSGAWIAKAGPAASAAAQPAVQPAVLRTVFPVPPRALSLH